MSELLKQLIQLLASALFAWIISKSPEFPLTESQFVAFIVYLFTLLGIISGLRFQWYLVKTKIFNK